MQETPRVRMRERPLVDAQIAADAVIKKFGPKMSGLKLLLTLSLYEQIQYFATEKIDCERIMKAVAHLVFRTMAGTTLEDRGRLEIIAVCVEAMIECRDDYNPNACAYGC